MPVCTQGHDPARAQTFLRRVRDGWRELTLSLCCPLTSSHPAPWQPHGWSLGEPQEYSGRSGTSQCSGSAWAQSLASGELRAPSAHVSCFSQPLLPRPLVLNLS